MSGVRSLASDAMSGTPHQAIGVEPAGGCSGSGFRDVAGTATRVDQPISATPGLAQQFTEDQRDDPRGRVVRVVHG
jgi:hypothetical protein